MIGGGNPWLPEDPRPLSGFAGLDDEVQSEVWRLLIGDPGEGPATSAERDRQVAGALRDAVLAAVASAAALPAFAARLESGDAARLIPWARTVARTSSRFGSAFVLALSEGSASDATAAVDGMLSVGRRQLLFVPVELEAAVADLSGRLDRVQMLLMVAWLLDLGGWEPDWRVAVLRDLGLEVVLRELGPGMVLRLQSLPGEPS